MRFSSEEREIVTHVLKKADERRQNDPAMRTIGFAQLFALCSAEEKSQLKKILRLNPRKYSFTGPYYGTTRSPKDLVMIRKERVPKTTRHLRPTAGGRAKYFTCGTHYLPRRVYEAYQQMNRVMVHDIGRRVFVLSGYRSPAYQLVVFLETLKMRKFDISRTAKHVAFPGYSEHGAPMQQAIDFTTLVLGPNSTDDSRFEHSKEYQWLTEHAHEFNFYLSYPQKNKWGVVFEPWHWHFNAKAHGRGKERRPLIN